MGLHKRHTHGRVFRGQAARDQLSIHKRDSHGDSIKMHVPAGFELSEDDTDVQTVASVVYVTLSQTFSGPAIYSTLTADASSTAETSATATSNASTADSTASDTATTTAGTSVATVIATKSDASAMTTLATASVTSAAVSTSASNAATVVGGTPIQTTRGSASATSQAISQDSREMSGGAKAGLAFGIILAVALACGLVFFCWRRKRNTKNQHDELMNEKHGSFADAGARRIEAAGGAGAAGYGARRDSSMTEKVPASLRSTRTASTAPRLSLRPITQFLPNIGENRKSNGNTLDVAGAGAFSEKRGSVGERGQENGNQNPFDDAPELSEKQARPESLPSNPFDEQERSSTDAPTLAPSTTITASKHSPKSSYEGTEPSTPRSAKFGTAAAIPVGATAGARGIPPGPRGPNNVHRVQLDFKPSMDDELELRTGQLVRMIHEYDDGWALCIRMDRSQQGVAPRTCLSKVPVKPRPQGPPPGQVPRPGTAQGSRRPSNPPQPPPNGLAGGAMYPRPLTPTQANRSPSPTESSTHSETSTSPVGVPVRKPVPGQAI